MGGVTRPPLRSLSHAHTHRDVPTSAPTCPHRPCLTPRVVSLSRSAFWASPRYPSPVGLQPPSPSPRLAPVRGARARCLAWVGLQPPCPQLRAGPCGAPSSCPPTPGRAEPGGRGRRSRSRGARAGLPGLPALRLPLGLPAQPPRTPASDPLPERVCDADAAVAAAAGRGGRARRGGGGERRGGWGGGSEITSPAARPAPPRPRPSSPRTPAAEPGAGRESPTAPFGSSVRPTPPDLARPAPATPKSLAPERSAPRRPRRSVGSGQESWG